MLKLNLLPSYIYERKKIRLMWALVGGLLVAEIAVLTAVQAGLIGREAEQTQLVKDQEAEAAKVQKLVTDADAEKAKIAPFEGKVDYIKQILAFNLRRPNLFRNAADYTFEGIKYSHMEAADQVLTITANAPSLAAAGRYLIYMQGNPDLANVQITAFPGYPPGNQNEGAGLGGGGSAGYGGPGGSTGYGPPGMAAGPGGPPGGPGGYGPPGMAAGPGGPPGGPGGYGPPIQPGGGASGPGGPPGMGYGGSAGYGGPGGYPGSGPGSGGGTGTDTQNPLPGIAGLTAQDGGVWGGAAFQMRDRLVPSFPTTPVGGFPFTVTATLVEPITRPYYGQSQTTDTSGSAGYGYPGGYGGPGGPPGGPGGGYGPPLQPGGPGGAANGP